jgi:hypothetical protein
VLGPKLWADAECMRRLRKACGADAKLRAEGSCGALVESQAFLGAGKHGLSGGECTKLLRSVVGKNPGTCGRRGSRPTAE